MARQENPFALLGDDDGDDVTALLANVAAKVVSSPMEKNQPQQKTQHSSSVPAAKFPSKPLPPSESVKAERGRGRGGRGRGLGRVGSGGSDVGQFGNGRANGYQRNYGDSDGNAADDGWRGRGRGRGRGGRGRGRGFNEDRGFGNDGQVHGGSENQDQGGAGWEEGTESQGKGYGSEGRSFRNENRPFRNENLNAGGERRGYGGGNRGFRGGEGHNYGDREGARYGGRDEGQYGSEKKEEQGEVKEQTGNNGDSINGGTEWDALKTTEVPKDVEPEQGKPEQLVSQDTSDKKVPEEEDNEMTLDEYEKLLFEKRKALEALKTEERIVTIDKDFKSMKPIEKKKEDTLFIKLKAEKDKLKKKDSLEKEEKVRKSVSINEFLKPVEGEKYVGPINARGRGGRGRGRGDRGGFKGGFSERSGSETVPAPKIEDPGQFPVLGGAVKA